MVLTGRVADPSLFLAPIMHEFGWSYDDMPRIAQGTAAGHLLECTASVTGGCFGWPGKKDVPDLAHNGYPFADASADGAIVIGKTPDTGGRLDVMTCTEQLIYEIHDPTAYITPDCVLDITGISLKQEASDRVRVEGARARPRTDTYKANVGYADGYIGEGEVSYGGIDAVAREETTCESDERTGVQILKRALEAPARQIAENSAVDGGVVVARMMSGQGNFGFDAARKEYVDLVEAGIVDPTKVVRVALQNAASVAGLLITTEAMITDRPKKDAAPAMPGGGMGGGMGDMDF